MEDNNLHHKPGFKNKAAKPGPWKLAYWIMGIGSLIWLLLRSGTKPKRLTYPCQRVAAVNSVGFLAYLTALLGSATLLHRLKVAFTPARLILFTVGLLLTVTLQSSITAPALPVLAESPDLPAWTSGAAVSNVFAITNVPEPQYSLDGGSVPGGVGVGEALHDEGVDALVELMEIHGDYFYKTSAHPDGLFGSDDVVVLKVNNQWDGRNGTNTDVVKGVIYRLVQHPDGFTGAVIIAENTQNHNDDWYHQSDGNDEHNSQFQDQSYLEVAQAFVGEGKHVCIADWKSIRTNLVPDYDAGNDNDGYVWDGVSSFDNTRLKMINIPVLKYHGAAGATIALKNYLGFITTAGGRWMSPGYIHCWLLSTSTADGGTCPTHTQEYGLIGRQMAHIRRADLDIVDAIWVNPCSNTDQYTSAQRQDVLLASRDPFAVDYYASDYLLGPLIQQFGSSCYNNPDDEQAMASTHGGLFRSFMMRNVERLRAEGVTDTINMDDSTMTIPEELAQFNVYVADANAPLTLLSPNGGETWIVGDQEQITWSFTDLAGSVKLEYSTDGFSTPHTIAADTSNDGSYFWTVPDAPSDNVLVRVSSTLTATISDTSSSVFTITYPSGPHSFADSFKSASSTRLDGGETITYTVVLYEQVSATLTLTDAIPVPCSYVLGSVAIEPIWKGPVNDTGGIHWSGTVTSTVPVTITFQVQVPVTDTTWIIPNRALVSRDGAAPVELTATSFLNGFYVYLPVVFRNY